MSLVEVDSLCEFFSARRTKKYVIIVIPQIHLAPYVYALILRESYLLDSNIILIHQTQYEMGFDIFKPYPNIAQIDIRRAHHNVKSFYDSLILEIEKSKGFVECFVLHNFAASINAYISEALSKDKSKFDKAKIFFYADGSRNNPKPEMSSQFKDGYSSLFDQSTLFYFGFVHNTSKPIEFKGREIVPYSYVDTAFKNLPKYSDFAKKNINSERRSLVLTRYWGREPYFFDNSISLANIFSESICKVLQNKKIIIRRDSRFNIDSLEVEESLKKLDFSIEYFESFFDIKRSAAERLLFENFIYDNPDFFKIIDDIYCFDSSFPLIFLNPELFSLIRDCTKIYVGFDRLLVMEYGIGECYGVMKKRTIESIFNLSITNRFVIYDCNGLVYCPSIDRGLCYRDLESQFELSDGYFTLRKF